MARQAVQESEFANAAIAVIALCFCLNVISRGVSETYSVFLPAIEAETGWSRSALSAIGATYMIIHGMAAPLAGAALDRFGPRIVYVLGLSAYGAGYLIAAQMETYWHGVLALGVLVGIGVSATGMAATSSLISRWFDRQLTTAMGLTYAGLSVGLITLAPLSERMITAFGWRGAYMGLGAALLALVPLCLLLPWGKITGGRNPEAAQSRTLLVPRKILRSPVFWGLFAVFFFTSIATWSIMLPLVSFLISVGLSKFHAALIYGLVGSASIIGMVSAAWLADRHGARKVVTATYAASIFGVVMLALFGTVPKGFVLVLFILTFGVTMGSRAPVVSTIVARRFAGNVGAVFGTVSIGLGMGAAVGSLLSGLIFDLTSGYGLVFACSIVASILGLAPFWLVSELGSGGQRTDP